MDAGKAVSTDLDAVGRGEGSAAVVDSSLQAGTDTRAGEERVAAPGDEPGSDEEEETVEQGGRASAARVAAEALGQPAARRPVPGTREVGRSHCAARSSGDGSRREKRESAAADDAAGRGADH